MHAPQVVHDQIDLVVDHAGDERHPAGRLARRDRLEDARAFLEQVIAQVHDQELRRERLAGVPCGASALATPAFRARVEVEQLFLREVRHDLGAERLLAGLELVHVDAQRLERPARTRAREPHVEGAREDVQVLRVGQVHEEPEHERPDVPRGRTTRRTTASRRSSR